MKLWFLFFHVECLPRSLLFIYLFFETEFYVAQFSMELKMTLNYQSFFAFTFWVDHRHVPPPCPVVVVFFKINTFLLHDIYLGKALNITKNFLLSFMYVYLQSCCLGYFYIAVIKHQDQKQEEGEKVYFSQHVLTTGLHIEWKDRNPA